MKNKHIAPLLLAFFGLAALSFTTAASIQLRLKPQQDKTYTVSTKSNLMMNMEVQGQTMSQTQNMETLQYFTTKEVTDAQTVVETHVESIKMNMSQMGMKLEYDSEHPEKTSPMLKGQIQELEKSLKKPVTITYDALGKVVSDSIDLAMNQLSTVITELPEEELTVGSKWNQTKKQEVSGIPFTVNMEYTVTAITKKSVDVSFTGNVDSKEVTGSYNGTGSINSQTGLMMTSTTKSNVSMTINEQGLSIPVTMVGTTTMELK